MFECSVVIMLLMILVTVLKISIEVGMFDIDFGKIFDNQNEIHDLIKSKKKKKGGKNV